MINSINIVLPLFIMAAVGVLVGKLGWLDEKTRSQLNKIIYDVLFPCSFFASTYNSAGKITISKNFILLIIGIEVVSFIITFFIAKAIGKNIKEKGALHQGMFRSNMILFGTAIASSMLQSDEVGIYTISLLVILPLQNIGSVLGQQLFGDGSTKTNFMKVLKGILTNTHVVAIVLGLVIGNLGIKIPDLLLKVCTDFGSAGSPVQLLVLGATLKLGSVKNHIKQLTVGVVVKLLLMSLMVVPFLSIFNLSFAESFVIMLLCSAPTAVTIFTISMKSGWDIDLANNMILYTTVFGLFTLTLWMSVLQMLA